MQAKNNFQGQNNFQGWYITIEPKEAKLTRSTTLGTMDPFCKIKMGSLTFSTGPNSDAGKYPKWHAQRVSWQKQFDEELTIEVWCKNQITSDDLVGAATISIQRFYDGKEFNDWIDIYHNNKGAGQVFLKIQFTQHIAQMKLNQVNAPQQQQMYPQQYPQQQYMAQQQYQQPMPQNQGYPQQGYQMQQQGFPQQGQFQQQGFPQQQMQNDQQQNYPGQGAFQGQYNPNQPIQQPQMHPQMQQQMQYPQMQPQMQQQAYFQPPNPTQVKEPEKEILLYDCTVAENDAEIRYAPQMKKMESMGFRDKKKVIQALDDTQGDYNAALDKMMKESQQ